MAWFLLITAGAFETGWALALKTSDGFTRLVPTILVVLTGIVSFALLALALKDLPVGVGYAVWTGIGTIGAAIAGVLLLGETPTVGRGLAIGLVTTGVILLALTDQGGA